VLLKLLHTQDCFRGLLAKLKREWEGHRREFDHT